MADLVKQVPSQILRRHDVESRTGIPRSTIYAKMASGDFPASIKLGARSVGWLESDIENWIKSKLGA